jgi:hypothetical protein
VENKRGRIWRSWKYWEIIADDLSEAGWGCIQQRFQRANESFGDAMAVEAGGTGKNEK